MIDLQEQLDLFKLIGTELKEKTECLAIGGSAMMFYNAKVNTKDVDLVFTDKKAFEDVKKTLKNIGFEEKKSLIKLFEYHEVAKNKPIMMEGRNTRFDLFLNEVISFKIPKEMLSRIKESHEFNNFIIHVASPEDIILLKCATERDKDREDALELINLFNINWNLIIKESQNQIKLGGELYPVFLYDFLIELKEEFKADIPMGVIKEVRKIGEEEMIKALKKGAHIKTTYFKNAKKKNN